MIYEGMLRPRPAQDDPREVFKKLFTNFVPPAGTAGTVDRSLEQRRSVLDFVMEDYRRIALRLGTNDRRKVDGHLQAIRQVEQQLTNPVLGNPALGAACKAPSEASASEGITDAVLKDQQRFPAIGKLQMDLMTVALACDLTRVASLQWSWARSMTSFSWINVNAKHHDLTHRPASLPLSDINRWYAQQVAYQVNALKAVDEGGRTLLDNTVLWWCSDVSVGANHSFNNIRAFLFGSCGGYLKTGQHIKFKGEPHNKLMVTLMHAMGMSDQTQFGDPTIAAGPLPGFG